METNFTIFAMIESLKSFRELNEEESVLEFRFVREPGSPTTLMIESIERVDDDAGLEREKGYSPFQRLQISILSSMSFGANIYTVPIMNKTHYHS